MKHEYAWEYTKSKPVKYIVFSKAAGSISGSNLDFTCRLTKYHNVCLDFS